MIARWMELRSFSNLGLRGMSKIGKMRALSSNEMSMKVVVGLEVSLGCLPGDVNESKVADQSVVETSSADMFPFVGAVPEHDGQWIAAGFAGHGKSNSTIELPTQNRLADFFLPQACPGFSSQQPISHPPFLVQSGSATLFQLLPLLTLLCRSLFRSLRRGSRSCKGRILPRGRSLPESGMARVVERSFVGIRGGCLLMLLWVLEGIDVSIRLHCR